MTTSTKTTKPAAIDLGAMKLSKAAAQLSTKVGKALDQQAAGARDLVQAIVTAPASVTRDQVRGAVYKAYVARGNSETSAKIRASEAGKVWDSRADLAPLVESGEINAMQAAARAAGNIKDGKAWDTAAPSKARKGSGPKTPSGAAGKDKPSDTPSVPTAVTRQIAEKSLRDHVNRLKANAKDEAAATWLSKVVDMIDLIG